MSLFNLFKKNKTSKTNNTKRDTRSKKQKFDDYVYKHTEKPEHYVHVDKPKTLQDYRQVQYNNWCKRNGVYNGSYLPEDPNTLINKGKGWVETKGKTDKTVRNFTRKSSGQMIRFDEKNENQNDHYHWNNGNSVEENRKIKKEKAYRDRYGKTCNEGSVESHLAPLDKDYVFIKRRKNESK